MRQIKFRGETYEGEWIYGSLLVQADSCYIFPVDAPDSYDNYQVIPKTVGQFTGLKDIHNEEIYEGDILAVPEFYETPEMTSTRYLNHQVVFIHGAFHLAGKEINVGVDDYNLYQESQSYDDRFEILSNIHTNPDLINQ